MRKTLKTAMLVIAALATPLAASAQVDLGARLGFALPGGKITLEDGGLKLDDFSKSQVPIQLDVLYRLDKRLSVGGYFAYGFVQPAGDLKTACDQSGISCTAYDLRFGVQGEYRFAPSAPVEPWLGLGLGYEINHFGMSANGFDFSEELRGGEIALGGGLDFRVADKFTMGPFVQATIAQYMSGHGEMTAALPGLDQFSGGGALPGQTRHNWYQLGIRGRFGL
jgi:outer membrane protein with beta-barrel domain